MMNEIWYRFEDSPYVSGQIHVRKFIVERYTSQGVRLRGGPWVSRFSRKRFAYPTVEEALESYKIRKRRQAGYGLAKTEHATRCLAAAEGGYFSV